MERARGCFRHLRTLFTELEECRAFELLKGQADRVNYLMTKQVRALAKQLVTHQSRQRGRAEGTARRTAQRRQPQEPGTQTSLSPTCTQAKIVAMTCTHAALKRREFIDLGFKYDNLLMEESGQILEIETFIPMLLQVRQPEGVVFGAGRGLRRVAAG